jgi:hypothetical protein
MADNKKTIENMEWLDGRYSGEVSDGIPHGRGELDWNRRVEYREGWKGGENDDVEEYLGQIRLGANYAEDYCSYALGDCAKYVGEFKHGHPDGEGTLTITDGSTYVGQFKDGRWHGEGTWTHPDGDEISGEWKEGQVHGKAEWFAKDEEEYIGEWSNGSRHGEGTSTFLFLVESTDVAKNYTGEWEDDAESGNGVLTYEDRVYEGTVSARVPFGWGRMEYEDGTWISGFWDEGAIWEGTEYDEAGNRLAEWDEGEREEAPPFDDAQFRAEIHENFDAPDLDLVATLEKGDLITVSWVSRDEDDLSVRFWLKVVENLEDAVRGTVENRLLYSAYQPGDEVVVPHYAVYDYIRGAVETYPEAHAGLSVVRTFDEEPNFADTIEMFSRDENSLEGASLSERVMTVLNLFGELSATYPTDINAHVEASGGWTDLASLESGEALLTPSTENISASNLEGGSVEVQHAETREKFWIKVVRTDASAGILYGLVKEEFAQAGLSRWQPVQCHIFQVWNAIFPRAKETLNLPDDSTYIGEMSDGLPSGEGTCTYADGSEYVGQFDAGVAEGYGTITYPGGVVFSGEWKNNNRTGQGVLWTKENGRPMVLAGEFKDGRATGQVTEILTDGSIYVGEVGNEGKEGHGTLTHLNGSKYGGEFRDNAVNGQGTWTYPNGEVYTGQWKDEEYHGVGTFTDLEGSRYSGEWKNSLRQGQGEQLYKKSARTFAGEWKNQSPWKGTVTDEEGAAVAAYLKGVRSDSALSFLVRRKWSKFVSSATSAVMESQTVISKEYGLNDCERFWLDQETGSLTFTHDGFPAVIAKIQYVGSVSTDKNDWLWSWANSSILEHVKDQMHVVREYGHKEGFTTLTTEDLIKCEQDIEQLGWQLLSVAHKLLDAKGAYRVPYDTGASFLIFTDVQKTGHFPWPADADKGNEEARNGTGTEDYPDGSQYVGEFKGGLFHGHGAITYAIVSPSAEIKGSKYVGEFKDGLFHGYGTLVLTDGTQYEGSWKEGKRDGNGVISDELFKCSGYFQDDALQGQGTYAFLDGSDSDVVTITTVFDGSITEVVTIPSTGGSIVWDGAFDGSYIGEVSDGVPNGRGIQDDFDGRYVGEWKDGKKHGQGTYTLGDGEGEGAKFVGEFKDGHWWSGSLYAADGNLIGTYSEGEQDS